MVPLTKAAQSNDKMMPDIDPINDAGMVGNDGASDDKSETYCRYDSYVELVLAYGIGFCPIAPDLFVVQGWDMRLGIGTVSLKE